jgi:NAD(P)-dependent dehydrogenase (short-subunit alcohol dehydrogenase family)/acyl carrier protein
VPAPPTPPNSALTQALQITQEGLQVFQRLQEQTAQLHRQFLQSQETAQQSLSRLIEQQQQLLLASLGQAPMPTAPALAVPAPQCSHDTPRDDHRAERDDHPQSPPAASAPSLDRNRVSDVLLEVVAEKTGYPAEMLNPDMGLDADLGIDSIKRVEILSALQERLPDAPLVKPEHLGTLNTLGEIVSFLAANNSVATTAGAAAPATATADRDRIQRVLVEVVAEKTGYPAEMLNGDMGLDADLGIDSIKRVEILSALQERLPNAPTVKSEHLGTLNTLGQIVDFLVAGAPSLPAAPEAPPHRGASGVITRQTLRSAPVPFEQDRPALNLPAGATIVLVGGADALADHVVELVRARGYMLHRVYWDSPVEYPSESAGLILLAPLSTTMPLLATGFRWLRASASALKNAEPDQVLLATVSRLDGAFGLSGLDAEAIPFGGGLAGLAKTAAHEWPNVACKAIDVDPRSNDGSLAERLAHELFVKGPLEVGIDSSGLRTIELVESPPPEIDSSLLGPSDVIIATGGARGITAEAMLALARTHHPTLVLFGRSPAPSDEPDWLRDLADERDIKRALGARLNGNSSPREINRRYSELSAQREIRANLQRLAAAGSRVVYRSIDVRNADAVTACVAEIRREFGPITGVIHGAGVIEDRLIEHKTDEQFDRVVGAKIEGLTNLLAATAGEPLRVLALFSSSTARFGRAGQVDYAVANEALNKIARREALRRPNCRVVSMNWGPWDGGMVTPELARLFEREGIGLIPLQEGARLLLSELSDPSRPIEVVAGVWKPQGVEPAAPIVHEFTQIWQRRIDIESCPVLAAHVLGGKAVVPLALHVEWLVHTALHANPGFVFKGLDGVRVLSGIKFAPDEHHTISAVASKLRKQDDLFIVWVELRSQRADGKVIVHSRGDVLLANSLASEVPSLELSAVRPCATTAEQAYSDILFHGPALHALAGVEGIAVDGIVTTVRTASPPTEWMKEPLRGAWLADPLAIDGAFQSLILWGIEHRGVLNLPAAIGRYRQFRRSFPAGDVRLIARVIPGTGSILRADFEWLDADGQLIARLEGGEFVEDANLANAFRQNQLALSPA